MSLHRVLLADPDASLVARYRAQLTKEGFTVATAHSGLECLERLGDEVPDVLILDPEMLAEFSTGVLDVLADGDELPWVHVVVLTARDCDLRSKLSALPISSWLVKPQSPAALAQHLRRLLKLPAQAERFVTEWA